MYDNHKILGSSHYGLNRKPNEFKHEAELRMLIFSDVEDIFIESSFLEFCFSKWEETKN